ncbi:MAG: hypothetical protein R2864_05485 [Syntrophotaleaceae bacterium]
MLSDFNPPRTATVQQIRSRRRYVLPLLVLAGLGALFLLSHREPAAHTVKASKEAQAAAPENPRSTTRTGPWRHSARRHHYLAARPYLHPQQIHNLSQQCKEIFLCPSFLAPARTTRLALLDGAFERLEYDIDNEEQLIILQNERADISRTAIPYTTEQQLISGTITSNSFGAVLDSVLC